MNAYDEQEDEELYTAPYFNRISEFADLNGDVFKSFIAFHQHAVKAGKLSVQEKELIAVASAHATGCPYCIDLHTKTAKKACSSKEELAEAIFDAEALTSGSARAHTVNGLNDYQASI